MRELAKLSLLTLAAAVWAGTATAGSIVANIINEGHVASETIYGPSDTITVELIMDSAGVEISSYFFHVDFDDASLSLVSASSSGSYPYPMGSDSPWSPLAGNLSVDAYGLYLNSYASGGKSRPGVFDSTLITELVFHVVDPGDGWIDIAPYFNRPGDVIGDENFEDISDQFTMNGEANHTEPVVPEPPPIVPEPPPIVPEPPPVVPEPPPIVLEPRPVVPTGVPMGVPAVPEPTAALLFSVGIIVIAYRSRRH